MLNVINLGILGYLRGKGVMVSVDVENHLIYLNGSVNIREVVEDYTIDQICNQVTYYNPTNATFGLGYEQKRFYKGWNSFVKAVLIAWISKQLNEGRDLESGYWVIGDKFRVTGEM